MEMTLKNLQAHAADVASRNGISLHLCKECARQPEEAVACLLNPGLSQVRAVIAQPIIDEATYAVVMHEIGHHLSPHGIHIARPLPGAHPRERHLYAEKKLVSERAAWEYARYYVEQVFTWTVAMEMVKQYALGTYEEGRRRVR